MHIKFWWYTLDKLLSDLLQCEEDVEIKVSSCIILIDYRGKFLESNWSLKGKGIKWKQQGQIGEYKIVEEIIWSNVNSYSEWHMIIFETHLTQFLANSLVNKKSMLF